MTHDGPGGNRIAALPHSWDKATVRAASARSPRQAFSGRLEHKPRRRIELLAGLLPLPGHLKQMSAHAGRRSPAG
jgi:hypothetical protein